MSRTYTELSKLESYQERLKYLQLLDGDHSSPRNISQTLYKSKEWLLARDRVIERDLCFDLGVFGVNIQGKVYVHHMKPVTQEDILEWREWLFDPEYLITVSQETHNLIHYGEPPIPYIERAPGDTTPWKKEEKNEHI